MARSILIVGGGTAGWITAGHPARMLGACSPGGVLPAHRGLMRSAPSREFGAAS